MSDITPPPIVKPYDYHTLKQITLPNKRLYETPDGSKVPSVTTILSKTKDMTHLNEWKKRVGEQNAQRIVTEASGVGSAMHANLDMRLIHTTVVLPTLQQLGAHPSFTTPFCRLPNCKWLTIDNVCEPCAKMRAMVPS